MQRSVLQNIHLYTKKFEGFLISIKIIISWVMVSPPLRTKSLLADIFSKNIS